MDVFNVTSGQYLRKLDASSNICSLTIVNNGIADYLVVSTLARQVELAASPDQQFSKLNEVDTVDERQQVNLVASCSSSSWPPSFTAACTNDRCRRITVFMYSDSDSDTDRRKSHKKGRHVATKGEAARKKRKVV